MATCTYSFAGGTSGSAVTTGSAGAGDTNFDAVIITSGCTLAFDSTHAHGGSLSCKVATTGTNTFALTRWGPALTSTSLGQVWFRLYVYLTAYPSGNYRVFSAYQTATGATLCAQVAIDSAGTLKVLSSTGSVILTTTGTLALGAWNRIEGYVIASPTVGQVEIKSFLGANCDGTTPDTTDTSAATANTGTGILSVQHGQSASTAVTATYWMDDLGASTSGYIGGTVPPVIKAAGVATVTGKTAAGVLTGRIATVTVTDPRDARAALTGKVATTSVTDPRDGTHSVS